MAMAKRPSCEPCRKSKLACDHTTPVCIRCTQRGEAELCQYRANPFKRRSHHSHSHSKPPVATARRSHVQSASPDISVASLNKASLDHEYPDPGFQGPSSYSTIHDQVQQHLSPEDKADFDAVKASNLNPLPRVRAQAELYSRVMTSGAELVLQLPSATEFILYKSLINTWHAQGIRLHLADPFAQICVDAIERLLSKPRTADWHYVLSERLLQNSRQHLVYGPATSLADFANQFSGNNARWEIVGMFWIMVGRATLLTAEWSGLYSDEGECQSFRRRAVAAADSCLELSLSMDCLNDLQMMLQYETYILHTNVSGNQSYQAWRRLGDIISTLSALGMHAQSPSDMPPFLTQIRRIAFASAYSADKTMCIYLGRPPRLSKRFCHFQLPLDIDWDYSSEATREHHFDVHGWNTEGKINIFTCRRVAMYSLIKEDILELFLGSQEHDVLMKADTIEAAAHAQWATFPDYMKLHGKVRDSNRPPLERDFLLSGELHYLQILFLLHRIRSRQSHERSEEYLSVASRMLSLVVQAILMREGLLSSENSLVWKVACYGLPAAGTLALELLNQSTTTARPTSLSRAQTIQNLCVLAAEIQQGNVIHAGDANYALLYNAAKAIDGLTTRILQQPYPPVAAVATNEQAATEDPFMMDFGNEDWLFPTGIDDDFWKNLAEHPGLFEFDETMLMGTNNA